MIQNDPPMPAGRGASARAARPRETALWRRWSVSFLLAASASATLVLAFVTVLDPFGLRVSAGRPARPLMDLNQRFMYPQLVRSGAFDSAVFGTSTMRLLDPARLSSEAGGRFANLAMNAATPWEQTEMARLFVRTVTAPKALVWGIDLTWCDADATAPRNRLTPRPFPPWLYDAPNWTDALRQMNLTTLEIALRLLAHRLGYQPARMRGDGYDVFTPPEASYDLVKARAHLAAGAQAALQSAAPSLAEIEQARRGGWQFPALRWLEDTLAQAPPATAKLIVLPPVHAGVLPPDGSPSDIHYQACKAALIALAHRQGATLADYAIRSPITMLDENYWDPLHYRLAIAGRVDADLAQILRGKPPADRASVRVSRPGGV